MQALAVGVAQCPQPVTADRSVRVDGSIAKAADQQRTTESTEASRSERQAPRCVQRAASCDSTNQIAVWIEHIDDTQALTVHFLVRLGRVLFSEGDIDVAANRLNTEWRKPVRQITIVEAAGYGDLRKCAVEYVNARLTEICG